MGRRFGQTPSRELSKQAECVPIGADRVGTGLLLIHEALSEKALEQEGECRSQFHVRLSQCSSSRFTAKPISSGQAVKYSRCRSHEHVPDRWTALAGDARRLDRNGTTAPVFRPQTDDENHGGEGHGSRRYPATRFAETGCRRCGGRGLKSGASLV